MGEKWERIWGPDSDPGNRKRYKLNKGVRESLVFIDDCRRVAIKPTQRQASKYRRKKGLAYLGA